MSTKLQTSGTIPRVVKYRGKRAFKVTFEGGKIHSGATNCNMKLLPPRMFPTTECRVSFQVWIAPNFPLTRTPTHAVAGKLGGFEIGSGVASGYRYSTTGSTFRIVFADEGRVEGYLYPQLKKAFEGDPSWAQVDQSEDVQKVSKIAAGIHVWDDEGDSQSDGLVSCGLVSCGLVLKKKQWNKIEMYVKLNTPGQQDGVAEVTVNGTTRRLDTVRYRNDDAKIEAFRLQPFFGGSTAAFAPPEDTVAYFANFKFVKK